MKRLVIALTLAVILSASLSACRGVSYMAGEAAGAITTLPFRLLKGGGTPTNN